MSKFIVIEGPDRVGKATQTKLLSTFLKELGYKVLTNEVPLKSNFIYHIIYWMLGNGLAKKFPKIFQWLQYFNRQIFQWTKLPSYEKDYDFIVMDRWSLSTVVYGIATGVPEEFTKKLYDRLKKPDYTIILLGPSHKHEVEDVYEADSGLQKRVREVYASWSSKNLKDSSIVNCSKERQEVSIEIIENLISSGIVRR